MDDWLEIGSPEQFKALSHPLRQRLLFVLGREPATTSQLAVSLGERKGNVGHHLKVLREAGLVRIVQTRQVRGGTEQYYQRTAHRMSYTESPPEHTQAMFAAVAEEIGRAAGEPLVVLRHLRLTPEVAARTAHALQQIVDETADAGEGEAVHGILVTLYRRAVTP
ncbi:winged helix-turn-helix domain-containing protein [Crossiella sp. SN42]|uniref:ArsR/SmtB family transcription factor n=1 Tax=Crossiella sp. SN42 TaxID=2944808 RepID=UPI00207C886D|nr:winged helix-turn-helix domain-containing protein [Crossiella sp. SN42]MCO1577497.1 winged helix-turn-helix domain-containing protein [Crossiella sp. SN42]